MNRISNRSGWINNFPVTLHFLCFFNAVIQHSLLLFDFLSPPLTRRFLPLSLN